MAADADRHLLFGLLALQNGLIDQDQLLIAFRDWTRDKARPLADHLVAGGALDADQRAGVAAMAVLHLRKHGGDVTRSLAAVPAGSSTRESLASLGDSDLDATIDRVSSRHASTEDGRADADRTITYAVGTATADGQRFRVLRPHARGGLGAVFVALDQELHREVALKQILDQHADDPVSRARFLLEAEVTGGLEHPGIVPVYGLGTYGDGRPYYAMRFVRGDNLKETIGRFHFDAALKGDPSRRSLELRKLLRRFVDVCNAIEYAHSRGVLHRDIKPGNVIVGKHGETLVVDWGLAKATGKADSTAGERTLMPSSASGSAETLPGRALGTPAYMSPEHAAGDLDRLGPRSDVYSLGATLYCLLTGKPPLESDNIGSVLRAVQRGEFPPPRAVTPTVDAALEAVCLKAMALAPGDRYGSPRSLAEDIERWMADEPVSAWREPWWIRARRQLVRHRSVLGFLAIGVPVALFSLSTIAVHEGLSRSKLERNNRVLRAAQKATADALARAGRREQLTLKALDNYRRAVQENSDLSTRPELAPLRRRLLDQPREFYRQLREEAQSGAGSPDAQAERTLILADASLASIAAETGSAPEAMRAYQEAIAVLEPRTRGPAADPTELQDLAIMLNNFGVLQVEAGRLGAAQATHRRALEIRTALHDRDPRSASARSLLSLSYHNLGWLNAKLGHTDSALADYRKAREMWESLVRESPEVESCRFWLAQTCNNLGPLLSDLNRKDEAREVLERARALLEPVAHANPNYSSYAAALANAYSHLAMLDQAVELHERALALREKLVRDSATIAAYRKDLAESLRLVGRIRHAEPLGRRAVAICEGLLRDQPESYEYRDGLARAQMELGLLLVDEGRPSEAIPLYERAIGLQEGLARENPDSPEVASLLAGSHNNRGLALARLGRHEDAQADYLKAIELERSCLASAPQVYQYRDWLSKHIRNLGKSLRATGRLAEAHAAALEGYRLRPDEPGAIYDYACDLSVLSSLVGWGREGITDAERTQRAAWADQALVELRRAIDRGFRDVRFITQDTDFDPIRSRPDFQALILDLAFPDDPFAR
jgi:serine/threonine-protein kinase